MPNHTLSDRKEVTAPHKGFTAGLMFVAVLSLALNLRAAASSVGPLLAEIGEGMDFSGEVLGFLTSLPGLIFGLLGLAAVRIGKQFGITATLLLSAGAIVFGIGLRAWVDNSWLFLVLTVIGLTGIAVANVLMPAWIKIHGRQHTVKLMTIYSVCVVAAGALGAATTAPLAAAFSAIISPDAGWRAALSTWGLVALVPLVLWWILNQRIGYDYPPTPSHHNATKKIYRSPAAWAMTAFFGLQSTQVYAQFGWLPQIYRDAGVGSTEAGLLLATTASIGVVGSLIMPTVVDRSQRLWLWPVGFGVLSAIGYLGLLWWPADARWIWAILLGIAGMAFPTSISLLPARSVDPDVTARLSGFVQPVGYILAGVGPLVIGALYTASNSWTTSLLVLLTLTLLMAIAGALSSRNINVDDQL
ncbi:MAG TPA: MFS transporter [Candidatus Yaniella excrementigallinarum]|nr:MFS transporter [Candidatus Yaniella excrementigallinarum]